MSEASEDHGDNIVNMGQASSTPRILVVKLSSLGDLFHVLPAVHALKNSLNATIDWVTQASYVDLVKCFTDVDRVIPIHRRDWIRHLAGDLRDLRTCRYDVIVDFQGILKSAVVARLARGDRRIGPSFHREGSWLLYSVLAGPRNRQRHAVEESLDIIRYLQLPVMPPVFPLSFPLQLVSEPAPRVALIPFSRWPSKNWPLASFVELGRELQEQMDASLFLLGTPGESAACAKIEKELKGRVVNLAGKTALPQLGGLLQAMDLVISNDSGPMHMAAAAGTPVLAIFGPTDSLRTGPYGPGHRVLKSKLRCQPCFSRKCSFEDGSCLRAVTLEMAASAAMEILRVHNSSKRKSL
ncbi:MAG: glycosyltransferase family 9 protein [Verrucomicrobia bacterium]|nr:glycosyltransferase family 9 protein [Verrucomicrobiota bacterium]MBU4246782.1 glycosyltransferase family 9 protein [Verrucomicrobiota bacterium]MBU4429725.1 glycosyltransferase family 9 protein [Verrucomicrobiota bacterium]MBU4496608.1 glycosyltransferase family 9 protein [Verrucomicrobiota bacterium]